MRKIPACFPKCFPVKYPEYFMVKHPKIKQRILSLVFSSFFHAKKIKFISSVGYLYRYGQGYPNPQVSKHLYSLIYIQRYHLQIHYFHSFHTKILLYTQKLHAAELYLLYAICSIFVGVREDFFRIPTLCSTYLSGAGQ